MMNFFFFKDTNEINEVIELYRILQKQQQYQIPIKHYILEDIDRKM